jgi:hypothetical protein
VFRSPTAQSRATAPAYAREPQLFAAEPDFSPATNIRAKGSFLAAAGKSVGEAEAANCFPLILANSKSL